MAALDWRMGVVLGTLVAAAGCYSPSPPAGAPCSLEGACPSGQSCVEGICGVPGQSGDDARTDADVSLPDGGSICECLSEMTLVCADGEFDCATRCVAASPGQQAYCARILPSNNVQLARASQLTVDIQFGFSTLINTYTGAISGGYIRGDGIGENNNIIYERRSFLGQQLGVFYVRNLELPTLGTTRAVGTRSLVIVSANNITIAGTLHISGGVAACAQIQGASAQCAGPGGGEGGALDDATGCGPGLPGNDSGANDSGGGGGGGGQAGANGGASTGVAGGNGGGACIQSDLEPLFGGSGGGAGSNTQANKTPGFGGGGGGAVQLVAANAITISNGNIYANGAGGAGGVLDTESGGGAGGGAGGGILLEAQFVSIHGSLTANGGAGGSGGSSVAGMAGAQGEDGRLDSTPAVGGASRGSASGQGGHGGTNTMPGLGNSEINAGGSGGSSGVILVRALSPPTQSGVASPSVTFMTVRVDQ